MRGNGATNLNGIAGLTKVNKAAGVDPISLSDVTRGYVANTQSNAAGNGHPVWFG